MSQRSADHWCLILDKDQLQQKCRISVSNHLGHEDLFLQHQIFPVIRLHRSPVTVAFRPNQPRTPCSKGPL